jgi:hypothetical protein
MWKAIHAALAITLVASGSGHAQSRYNSSTYNQASFDVSTDKTHSTLETYAYCIASDGHYTLYSSIFQLRDRQLSEITTAWRNYVKTAKPRLDFGDDSAAGASTCSIVLAKTAYQAATAEAISASTLQRATHSVRSFGTAWSY